MILRKLAFLVFSLCVNIASYAQSEQQEINEQVWKPFISAFNGQNADQFLSVHSKELIRSPRDSKVILNWNEYLKQTKDDNASAKADGTKVELELHFTERISTATSAIDVGIYKTTVTPKNGASRAFYGRFHVALRKENGVWKILVDTDYTEGGTIGEKDFAAAKPL